MLFNNILYIFAQNLTYVEMKHILTTEKTTKYLKKESDYKLGINILKTYLLNNGLYHIYYSIVNNDKWVFNVSWLLAEKGICELFWKNTVEQEYISNIIACETIEDIFYDRFLFEWAETKEGDEFWLYHGEYIISKYQTEYGTIYLSKEDEENNEIDFDLI